MVVGESKYSPLNINNMKGGDCMNKEQFADGQPIGGWMCGKCAALYPTLDMVETEVTGGRYGPNGNGWKYWSKCCHYDCSLVRLPVE